MKISDLTESKSAPLYHRTSFTAMDGIITSMALFPGSRKPWSMVKRGISLSRNPKTKYFTNQPVILVLDQEKLIRNHKIVPYHGDSYSSGLGHQSKEQEERILSTGIAPVTKFLLGVIVELNSDTAELDADGHLVDEYEKEMMQEIDTWCSSNNIPLFVKHGEIDYRTTKIFNASRPEASLGQRQPGHRLLSA